MQLEWTECGAGQRGMTSVMGHPFSKNLSGRCVERLGVAEALAKIQMRGEVKVAKGTKLLSKEGVLTAQGTVVWLAALRAHLRCTVMDLK